MLRRSHDIPLHALGGSVKAHRVSFALASLCLGSAFAVLANASDQGYSQRDAERYIQESEAAWASSVATNDASVVRRILADDLVWVLDGRVLDKAQAVAEAEKGPYDFLSNHLEYAHVRFFGDTAVVQGSEKWTRRGGKSGRFVWTDTWLRRNGQWQIVASEDVSVPIKE
ncbi:MAG TPA: nuclear transport factor 2 family protein [Steroidobacteraceae bacterium]